jgi:hypothetical protein
MKNLRFVMVFTVLLALLAASIAYAAPDKPETPVAPESVSTFTITPSSAYVGDNVTFTVEFTVAFADLAASNNFCLYYTDSDYTATFNAVGDLTSDLGDTYAQTDEDGTLGNATGSCPGLTGTYVIAWSIVNPSDDAEFGDAFAFSFTVPTNANTQNLRLRQRNGTGQVGGSNKTLTILTVGATVYVANDTATCGSNTPCRTGTDALNWALDNVSSSGTVIVLGAYNMSSSATADLTTDKTVMLTGQSGASLNNAAGACISNAMITVNSASANLTVTSLTIDGSCSSGNRSAGILNTAGTTNVKTGTSTLRDFTGSNNAAVEVTGNLMVVENNTFINNEAAMEQSGTGTLYAFANNVSTNIGALAAVASGSANNVKCNYWGAANISGFGSDYSERLGSEVISYIEGAGLLTLANASLSAGTGNQVLINLGRDTSNPPFNNGTTSGLGALVSDFYAACLSRDGSGPGTVTLTGDNQTPGTTGFRLYEITSVLECSPATNTTCWDYQGSSCAAASCQVSDPTASEGHFVVGNEFDPTALTLTTLTATSARPWLPVALVVGLIGLVSGSLLLFRKRQ